MLVDEYQRVEQEAALDSAAEPLTNDDTAPADVGETRSETTSRYAEEDFSSHEKRLIDQARNAWDNYLGGDGDREKAYDDHSMLLAKLFGRGICWGREEQYQA